MMSFGKNRLRRGMPGWLWSAALLLLVGVAAPAWAQTQPTRAPDRFRRFALELEARLGAGEAAAINEQVDIPGLVALITLGYEDAGRTNEALASGLASRLNWGDAVVATTKAGGNYRLLRVRQQNRQVRALFRLVTPTGLNYHDMLLVADAEGVYIRDIYVYATGESISQSLRRSYLYALSQNEGLDRLWERDRVLVQQLPALGRLQAAMRDGRFAAVEPIYRELPARMRQEPVVLQLRTAAAARLDGATRQAAVAELARLRPNDPSRYLILAEAARSRGDSAGVTQAIDSLSEMIGGDPYLLVYRGEMAMQDERYDAARSLADRALTQDGHLPEGHLLRIAVLLAQEDYYALRHALDDAARRAGLQFGDLREQPAFAAFLASEPGRDWYEGSFLGF